MRSRLYISICLLFIVIPFTASAQEYTLDDLFRISLERSETIKISEEDLALARINKKKSLAVFLPTMSLFADHTRYTESKNSPFGLLQPDYTNQWGFRIEQTFSLVGRELTAYKMAKDKINKGRYSLQSAKEVRLLEVANAYYNVMKSRKAHEIASANVERLIKHRNASRTRVEVGDATKTALLRAEAELAGARSEMIRSENTILLTKSVLANTVGIDHKLDVKEPVISSHDNNLSVINEISGNCTKDVLACLQDSAGNNRAEIISLNIDLDVAEKEIKYRKGSYWPELTLEGVYFREKNEPARSFELDERIYGVVRFDFPFFEGGLRRAEVAESKAKLRQAEHILADSSNSINVEVEEAYLNLKTISSIIVQLEAEVTYATENFRSVEKQFQHGLADSIDVIDANTLLVTAERELANAQYDYQYAIINLKRSAGVLLKSIETTQSAGISKINKEAR